MTLLAQNSPDLSQVEPIIFFGLALLIGISAWAIVMSNNIVHIAVFLLFTLAGVAGLYFMMEAELLAAIQLIVYAGGTLILIIFGVMLTSKNPFMQLRVKLWEKSVAVMLALAISGLLGYALISSPSVSQAGELLHSSGYDQVKAVGVQLLSTYLVPFEVAAVLLLVVMIGAAYMARRRTPS